MYLEVARTDVIIIHLTRSLIIFTNILLLPLNSARQCSYIVMSSARADSVNNVAKQSMNNQCDPRLTSSESHENDETWYENYTRNF